MTKKTIAYKGFDKDFKCRMNPDSELQKASSRDSARIGSSGGSAQIGSSGYYARIIAEGENSVIASAGHGAIVSGAEGTWVSVAEYDDGGKCVGFATGRIGQNGLKPKTQYKAEGGDLVPACQG